MNQKDKLDDSWFKPDVLVWLHGSYGKITKRSIKEELDNLNIKWTNKYSTDVTNVITTRRYYWCKNYPVDVDDKLIGKLKEEQIIHPAKLIKLIKNLSAPDMSEYNTQILTLLESNDENNIDLAVTLIGDSLIENNWVPWLLMNKDNSNVKELLIKNNISRGQWFTFAVERDFNHGIWRLENDFNVTDDYLVEFTKIMTERYLQNKRR